MGLKDAAETDRDWVTFPGGELEGKRPKALCKSCRAALQSAFGRRKATERRRRTLCFQCYRAELERERALRDAGDRNTTSVERFQYQLPLEPINRPRLAMLKAARVDQRAVESPLVDWRRRAQIEARHALQQIAVGLAGRGLASAADHQHAMFQAVRAAELQLPESWLPFVVSR